MNIERVFPRIQRISNRAICLKKARLFGLGAVAWLLASFASSMEKHHAMGTWFTGLCFGIGVLYGLKAYALYSRSRNLGNGLF